MGTVSTAHPYNRLRCMNNINAYIILKKRKNRSFSHPLWALRGNVRTPSMARWKARGRHYIRRN